jgi:hypothetical protein
MTASRLSACAILALILGATGCTVAGTRTSRDASGWETATTYDCNWKRDSTFLNPNNTPNSPVMPFTRGHFFNSNLFVGIFGIPLDAAISPIMYLADRECWVTATSRNYVGTPESIRAAKLAQEKQQADAARRDTAAQRAADAAGAAARKKADADAAAAKAEADKIAAMYPPLSESPRAAPLRPDDFALIVGIEGYRSIGPRANYAEGDAKLVKTYIESLGVPAANIILLTGADAGRADIAKYLEEWLPGVVKADSRVYFYYSGHGAPDPASGTAYLVPFDGDPKFLKSTAFPLEKIYADLSSLPDKESVVMLDSCFSGAGGRSVLADGVRPLVNMRDAPTAPDRTAILSASGANEIAGGLDLQKHGLFTYYLLRGLGGEADADHDGHVTLAELDSYVRTQVSAAARRDNRDQNPRFLGDGTLKMY